MTTKQNVALWLGSLVMLAWSTAAAATGSGIPAVQNGRGGLQTWSGAVWNNDLGSAALAQFPRRCERTGTCQFTIYLDFFPGAPGPGEEDPACVDDPVTPWFDCSLLAQCVVWVQFDESIMPVSETQFRVDPVTGQPADKAVLVIAFDGLGDFGRTTGNVFVGSEGMHGSGFQLLRLVAGAVHIFPADGLCLAEVALLYHPSSKTVFRRGLLLPQ